jgi:hypothetical protein
MIFSKRVKEESNEQKGFRKYFFLRKSSEHKKAPQLEGLF